MLSIITVGVSEITKHGMITIIPVRQSSPVHPCKQVQFSGAVQFMFKPQPPVQIAIQGHDIAVTFSEKMLLNINF